MKIRISGARGELGGQLLTLFSAAQVDVAPLNCHIQEEHLDMVIHLAAKLKTASITELIASNLTYLQEVLSYCQITKPGVLIYASSISLYGNSCERVLDETMPSSCSDAYSCSKFLGEQLVAASLVPSLIIRLPAVLELIKTTNFISSLYQRLSLGAVIHVHNPDQPFNHFIGAEEFYSFLISLKAPFDGCELVNLAAASSETLRTICQYLKEIIGSRSEIIPSPSSSPHRVISIQKACQRYSYQAPEVFKSLQRWVEKRKKACIPL